MPYTDYAKRSWSVEPELLIEPRLLHVGSECSEPDWYNLEHSHSACELIYLLEGNESAIISGQRY